MKYFIVIVTISILASSCFHSGSVPSDLIQEKQMDSLLWDMSVAEEFAITFIAKDSTKDKNTEIAKEYEKVFALHNVTKEQFKRSYNYYESNPEVFKKLIDSTNARAQRGKQDLYRNDLIKF